MVVSVKSSGGGTTTPHASATSAPMTSSAPGPSGFATASATSATRQPRTSPRSTVALRAHGCDGGAGERAGHGLAGEEPVELVHAHRHVALLVPVGRVEQDAGGAGPAHA